MDPCCAERWNTDDIDLLGYPGGQQQRMMMVVTGCNLFDTPFE